MINVLKKLSLLSTLVVGTLLLFIWFQRGKIPDEEYLALENAQECTLRSVEKDYIERGAQSRATYLGCIEFGKVQLTGQAARQAIAVVENAPALNIYGSAHCFIPRHAVQIEANGHAYDFLICFECGKMAIFKDGKWIKTIIISGSPSSLNDILTKNGI